ncbi:STP1 protein [Plasmodium brasilianum]|uniref:STP1 protein n=1 Tax=Plasmodium brasilianum TaxID=5824 RepID=UPI00350E359C|nr:STP1 protein [Plasmodium brasilianum]
MDNCFSSEWRILGSHVWSYYMKPEFKDIGIYIQENTRLLNNEDNKEKFRNKCKEMAHYLIQNKKAPQFVEQSKWEETLIYRYQQHYKELNKKFGGCFMILDNNKKKLLELKYEAEDFCEQNKNYNEYLTKFKVAGNTYNCKGDAQCMKICNIYNEWITERQKHFKDEKSFIEQNCKTSKKNLTFPTKKCNLMRSQTFGGISKCLNIDKKTDVESVSKETSKGTQEKEGESITQVLSVPKMQASPQEEISPREDPLHSELLPSQRVIENPGDSEKYKETETKKLPESETFKHPLIPESQLMEIKETSVPLTPVTENSKAPFNPATESSSFEKPIIASHRRPSTKLPEISGMFKKKEEVKRKHMKFLRIIIPSFSNIKSMLSYDRLEQPIYNEDEIIKKIEIHEHNMRKDINMSKQKKDISKTIIEVHMEVLQEFMNIEWENKKVKFLEICLEDLTEEEYKAYQKLTNDELIIDNFKSTNDMKKKIILCNEWLERHRNIYEKLKRVEWFNNLKNEWKIEKDYIKEMEELNETNSNEYNKVPFPEREKETWRQWISKKSKVVKQYLEQEWTKGFSQELENISYKYENKGTKEDAPLINVGELENKDDYEELYKYIKNKSLAKLCILVLMMILEECEKENFIGNRESYFDGLINELKTDVNLGIKTEISENITGINGNVLENKENIVYMEENNYRRDMNEWVTEDTKYLNFIDSDNNLD